MASGAGAAAFFNRPRPNQLDPNGNSIFTNYGFQDEVAAKVSQFKFFKSGAVGNSEVVTAAKHRRFGMCNNKMCCLNEIRFLSNLLIER
jgi:hypothetical protein